MTWLVRWGQVRSGQISSVGSVGNQCCVLLPLNSACYGYVWRATCCASTWKPEQDINNSTTHILTGTARVCLKTFKIYLVGKVISKQPPSLMFTHNLIASSLICRRVDYGRCNTVRYKRTCTYVPTLVHIQFNPDLTTYNPCEFSCKCYHTEFTLVRFLYSLQLNNTFFMVQWGWYMYGTMRVVYVWYS